MQVVSSGQPVVGVPSGGGLFQIQSTGAGPPRFIIVRAPPPNLNLQNMTPIGRANSLFIPGQVPVILPGVGGSSTANPVYVNGGSAIPGQIIATSGVPCSQPSSTATFQAPPTQAQQKSPPKSLKVIF